MDNDNRILYDFDIYKYTVSDIHNIYQECSKKMERHDLNDLKFLYDFFKVEKKSNFSYCRSYIIDKLLERIAIISMSCDIEKIKREIITCRRKFYYWEDLEAYIYFINEKLDYYNTNKRFKKNILIDKKYYDQWIAYACYILII